jgi:succinoglycan biosynthesis protein ExoM
MLDSKAMEQIAVCVCTYRRPLQLARLLKALVEMARPADTRFVIVNNDGCEPETENLVRDFQNACRAPVTYVVETEPGLSAARNAVFKAARGAGISTVALLDDDEWPSGSWLTKLIDMRRETGAAVVGGPVCPVFEAGKAPSVKYQSLWSVQKGRLRELAHVYCTCNCLIDLGAVAFLGDEPFSSAFRFTGGEDVVFFRRLHAAGMKMAWAEEAVVFEEISGERATFGWLRRRWYRLGNIGVRCERTAPVRGDMPAFAKTILLALRLLIYPLFNRRVFTAPLLWLLEGERVRGRLASHAGFTVIQYGREGGEPSCLY